MILTHDREEQFYKHSSKIQLTDEEKNLVFMAWKEVEVFVSYRRYGPAIGWLVKISKIYKNAYARLDAQSDPQIETIPPDQPNETTQRGTVL